MLSECQILEYYEDVVVRQSALGRAAEALGFSFQVRKGIGWNDKQKHEPRGLVHGAQPFMLELGGDGRILTVWGDLILMAKLNIVLTVKRITICSSNYSSSVVPTSRDPQTRPSRSWYPMQTHWCLLITSQITGTTIQHKAAAGGEEWPRGFRFFFNGKTSTTLKPQCFWIG